jgi:lipoate-protein ligase A
LTADVQDLLDDINAPGWITVATTGRRQLRVLGEKFEARESAPGSNIVEIVALDPTITSFTVTVANTADPAFRDLGFQSSTEAVEDDSGDLLLGDRKVGGLAIKRGREAMMLHGTLLVAADIEVVASLLRHPLREPAYRRGRAHAEFLANLDVLDRDSLERRVAASLAALSGVA